MHAQNGLHTCVWERGGAWLAQRDFSQAPVSKFHTETSLLPSTEQVTQDGLHCDNGAAERRRTLAPERNQTSVKYTRKNLTTCQQDVFATGFCSKLVNKL